VAQHPAIEDARRLASVYRVLPAQRGFNVWRFFAWDREPCGWRVIVANVPTRADGWIHVLKRMGLTTETPAQPLPAPHPIVVWGDEL
jgi:hypothetical protein